MEEQIPYKLNLRSFVDERGKFTRLFDPSFFADRIPEFTVKNINSSINPVEGTIRGLHYQRAPFQETKIIFCLAGKIFDVGVNINKESVNYLRSYSTILEANEPAAFVIPKNHAHGFMTLEPNTHVLYLVDAAYNPSAESSIYWKDPLLSIDWPMEPRLISEKDRLVPLLKVQ